jgi:hypothetical protein
MTIKVFCKKYLRQDADRKLADGTFEAHIREHITAHGASPTDEYNVRYHGDGATVTVWNKELEK